MSKFVKKAESFIDKVGQVTSYGALIIMILIVYEVMVRRIFKSPTLWTAELLTMIYGAYFILGIGYSLLKKSVVAVDLLYAKLNFRRKRIVDIVTYCVFFFPFVIGSIFSGAKFAKASFISLERSWSTWSPPVYYFKASIAIGFVLLFIQGLCEMFRFIEELKKGE